MAYLYESFDTLTQFGAIQNKRISLIEDNLSPKLPIREYQIKAFSRFDYFYNTEFEGKQVKPYHLLYNMATGSGKTLVMAGLMLYLYEKGYRNFLFFVNSKNIIKKTKENFLNSKSFKYLFNESLFINGEKVEIKQADTFDASDERNINIKFTTIQQLYTDLELTIIKGFKSVEWVRKVRDEMYKKNKELSMKEYAKKVSGKSERIDGRPETENKFQIRNSRRMFTNLKWENFGQANSK